MTKSFSILAAVFAGGAAFAQEATVDPEADTLPEATVVVEEDVALEREAEPDPNVLLVVNAEDVALDDLLWQKRLIVVFADTEADPRYREQLELLLARPEELVARDVMVITDANPDARSEARLKFRPRGFQLTLVGKDGRVNLRKPFAWDVREITHAIDKWPLRIDEIRARGG